MASSSDSDFDLSSSHSDFDLSSSHSDFDVSNDSSPRPSKKVSQVRKIRERQAIDYSRPANVPVPREGYLEKTANCDFFKKMQDFESIKPTNETRLRDWKPLSTVVTSCLQKKFDSPSRDELIGLTKHQVIDWLLNRAFTPEQCKQFWINLKSHPEGIGKAMVDLGRGITCSPYTLVNIQQPADSPLKEYRLSILCYRFTEAKEEHQESNNQRVNSQPVKKQKNNHVTESNEHTVKKSSSKPAINKKQSNQHNNNNSQSNNQQNDIDADESFLQSALDQLGKPAEELSIVRSVRIPEWMSGAHSHEERFKRYQVIARFYRRFVNAGLLINWNDILNLCNDKDLAHMIINEQFDYLDAKQWLIADNPSSSSVSKASKELDDLHHLPSFHWLTASQIDRIINFTMDRVKLIYGPMYKTVYQQRNNHV